MITGQTTLFPILVLDTQDGPDRLLELVRPELDSRGLDRLVRVLEGQFVCVVVERHYIDKDYRDTFSHFHSKRFNTPPSRCVRLHFFAVPVTEESIISGDTAVQSAYRGYSVIRPTKPNCIGRTLLSHEVRHDRESHLCLCREKTMLLGTEFSVEGFPFISQDADATVCAESALWMLFRYYSNRYPVYSEILPFQVTSLAANHATGSRVYPSPGLYSWQLAEALRLKSFAPVVYSRTQYPDTFDHLLYTYIESGIPVLITVPQHVVVGYGHTSDFTRPVELLPNCHWPYSSCFNTAFVISDDNHHPYQMLRMCGTSGAKDSSLVTSDIAEFIVPLPERVFLTAEQFQVAMQKLLTHAKYGIASIAPDLAGKPLTLRMFLTSTRAFKKKLRERGMGNIVVEQYYRHLPMPHFIWVCEIAREDEYRQGMVCGEVIWDATRNAYEPDGWIALHILDALIIDKGSAINNFPDIQGLKLVGSTSYELFRSNLHSL